MKLISEKTWVKFALETFSLKMIHLYDSENFSTYILSDTFPL